MILKAKRPGLVAVKKQVRTKKGRTKTVTYWVRPEDIRKPDKAKGRQGDVKESISVKGLNKDVDFKANMEFLNKEIGDTIKDRVAKLEENIEHSKRQVARYEADLADDSKVQKLWEDGVYGYPDKITKKEVRQEIGYFKRRVEEGIKKQEQEIKDMKNLSSTESFCQNLTPVHSLDIEKFKKVLEGGGLKALTELEESGKQNSYAWVESEIRPKYGDATAELLYKKIDSVDVHEPIAWTGRELGMLPDDMSAEEIKKKIYEIKEGQTKGAIGYSVDKEIGTNQHVFSIMGPNGNGSGYGEISIVLKQDIMKHPDFNMTPVAGTSFVSGEVYNYREWTKGEDVGQKIYDIKVAIKEVWTSKIPIKERIAKRQELVAEKERLESLLGNNNKDHFHKSKLNAKENPDYHKYMAKDLAAQGGIEEYLTRSSHGKWEAHLPAEVPTSMFAEVIMPTRVAREFTGVSLTDEMNKAYDLRVKSKDEKFVEGYKAETGNLTMDFTDKSGIEAKEQAYTNLLKKRQAAGAPKEVISEITGKLAVYQDLGATLKMVDRKLDDVAKKHGIGKITVVGESSDILPYMNDGFKEGTWRKGK